MNKIKVLILDIETAPLLASVWKIWDENIGLGQIERDTFVLAWAAKWLDSKKIMYMDQRNAKNIEDDKKILEGIWKLMDEADIIIGQNHKSFDIKRLNARFIINGMKPPSSSKMFDTLRIAKKHFSFTSNKLEYLSKKLCKKHNKSSHGEFGGFNLWKECLAGNPKAWKAMEKYNKDDVLATEELFHVLAPWDSSLDFSLFTEKNEHLCKCGSKELTKNGFAYTSTGKFQRYCCVKCGCETRDRVNLFSKEKKQSLKVKVNT